MKMIKDVPEAVVVKRKRYVERWHFYGIVSGGMWFLLIDNTP